MTGAVRAERSDFSYSNPVFLEGGIVEVFRRSRKVSIQTGTLKCVVDTKLRDMPVRFGSLLNLLRTVNARRIKTYSLDGTLCLRVRLPVEQS
jgi:hypothetical protein